jgi:hypothetical protein
MLTPHDTSCRCRREKWKNCLKKSAFFWTELTRWLLGTGIYQALIEKLQRHIDTRLNDAGVSEADFFPEALIVEDHSSYQIGPHTDAAHRLMSLLFYCPDSPNLEHLGTSIYVPKEHGFKCKGGPHYSFAKFDRVTTMPYRPNSLFAFMRTDESFHGVEPITDQDIVRDLLLYDIRITGVRPSKNHQAAKTRHPSLVKRILGAGFR